jgi:hypothetical protein
VRLIADRNPELFNIPTDRGVGGKRFPPFCFRIWRRDTLAGYLQKMLLDWLGLERPRLEGKTVEKKNRAHFRGNRIYTSAIHMPPTLQIWNEACH